LAFLIETGQFLIVPGKGGVAGGRRGVCSPLEANKKKKRKRKNQGRGGKATTTAMRAS